MTPFPFGWSVVGGFLTASLFITGAGAHHGWAWAESDQVTLKGAIRDIHIGQPHPTLQVETPGDGVWIVELANPGQTARAGFVKSSAKVGDPVTAVGNRSRDPQEKRMKAVRITVDGKTYDIYPERIRN